MASLSRDEEIALADFTETMKTVLTENAHWQHGFSASQALNRLHEEVDELVVALHNRQSPEEITREAADVANFCMMIADLAGGLRRSCKVKDCAYEGSRQGRYSSEYFCEDHEPATEVL